MAASDAILELEGKEEKLVKRLLQDSFRYRCDGMSESKLDGISEALGVEKVRAKEVISELQRVISGTLYDSRDRNGTVKLLPKSASKNLKILLANEIADQLPRWRESSVSNLVSPPKLIDFDWRVDVASSSSVLSRMILPTVFVEITIQEQARKHREMSGTRNIHFELSKEALGTLVRSLGKIRDQLSNVK
ncbi:hypothetical protein AAMO2058_001300900 [Amorphochlora amoebiformis]